MRKRFDNPDGNPDITNIPISEEDDARGSGRSTREPELVPQDDEPEAVDPFYEAARAAEDRYIRLMADFENYRRRAMKEREAAEVSGVENVVRPLLDVLDNLDRALAHADAPGPLRDGVALTVRQFQNALQSAGVLPIEPRPGEKFDPALHEAISTMPDPRIEAENVLQVISRGYRIRDRVIRPARVIVSSGGEGRAAS